MGVHLELKNRNIRKPLCWLKRWWSSRRSCQNMKTDQLCAVEPSNFHCSWSWYRSIELPTPNALSFYKFQNVLCWSKFFVSDQKFIYILCQSKRWFAFSKIGFCGVTKVFEEALNEIKFLDWLKTFGPAQNILGLVKGQGIRFYEDLLLMVKKTKLLKNL